MGIFMGMNEILSLIAEIDEFKGRWQATHTLTPDRLQSLRKIATIESVGSSTRIEGAQLTNDEIEKLLSGLKVFSFRSRDEQEVAGYAEVMEVVFHSFTDISLSENYFKQLHGMLLKHSEKDQRHRGEYKKFPNHVEAFALDGTSLGVVFKTCPPFDTPLRMTELVQELTHQFEIKELHPLLIIGNFVVTFLAIHPFQDGNGRLSRILTTLLLLKAGYTYVPYCSLERIIEENKANYYLSLKKSQESMTAENPHLEDWLVFFLRCLQKQKNILTAKISESELLQALPPLSLQIIEAIKTHGTVSVAAILALTQANRNTIKLHLKKLVADGLLILEGQGKASRYRIKVR